MFKIRPSRKGRNVLNIDDNTWNNKYNGRNVLGYWHDLEDAYLILKKENKELKKKLIKLKEQRKNNG